MAERPALDEFQREIESLRTYHLIAAALRRGEVNFGHLTLEAVAELMRTDAGHYFLLAAAGLTRTTLRKATKEDSARIVQARMRRAFVVKERLPIRKSFSDVASSAVALRRGDLERKSRGAVEALFRERLLAERIPILMSPPVRQVPGILIGRRKPDGVYPDPSLNEPPLVYLEVKNVRRVADDIQKRLYEVAEAAIEMKFLYGSLELRGLGLKSTEVVRDSAPRIRAELRAQIRAARPTVVVLMLCGRAEAERYREGAEAFVDRLFFQEEIDECLEFLRGLLSGR